MLRKKMNNGDIAEFSVESVQGGILLTLEHIPVDRLKKNTRKSVVLNPVNVSKLIDGLLGQFCRLRGDGLTLEFSVSQPWEHIAAYISIKPDYVDDDIVIFPLHNHEIRFIRKALENMAESMLFVGTWSGEPEAL